MNDYSNENTSIDVFHFSVSVTELSFNRQVFLACQFFIIFIRKLTQMLILTLFFRILGNLTEKRQTLFNENKNINKIYAFTIKIDLRMCQKVGSLVEKQSKTVSRLPICNLFLKKLLFLLKNDERLSILNCKKKCTFKFNVITIKSAFKNMPICREFRFENSLKIFL